MRVNMDTNRKQLSPILDEVYSVQSNFETQEN